MAHIYHGLHSIEPARFHAVEKKISLLDQSKQHTHFLQGFLFLLFSDALSGAEKEKYLKQAVNCFKETIKIDPSFVPAYYNQAHALMKLGEFKLAIQSMEMAMQYSCYYNEKIENIGTMLYPILYDEWRQEKERTIRDNLNNTTNLFLAKCLEGLGDIFIFEGDFNGAGLFYKEALKYNCNSTEILKKLAESFAAIRDYAESAKMYESIIERRPFFIEAWRKLPKIYLTLNEKKKLEDFCKQILIIINTFSHLATLKEEFEGWIMVSEAI